MILDIKNQGFEKTVIAFSGVGSTQRQTPGFEFQSLAKEFNVIFVVDEHRSWFSRLDIDEIKSHIKTDNVYTIGSSMGAHNAIQFANYHTVQKVLAFTPQYSVDPKVVAWEKRWRYYTNTIKDHKDSTLRFNESTQYLVYVGSDPGDVKQINMMPELPNLRIIRNPQNAHNLAGYFKEQGELRKIISDYFG